MSTHPSLDLRLNPSLIPEKPFKLSLVLSIHSSRPHWGARVFAERYERTIGHEENTSGVCRSKHEGIY
jgi:hypothetical protein